LEILAAEGTSTAVGTAAAADISHSKGSKDVNKSKNNISRTHNSRGTPTTAEPQNL
jgi:hypothetical protein